MIPRSVPHVSATHSISHVAHRVATHLDAVSIMYEPVENTVGQRRIADLFVPARDRQLRGQ
jgi:hypothetical protein